MNTFKLFIVDDEWMIADSLGAMEEWADRGIEVVGTAYNAYDAISVLEERHADLVITDIRMPDMDGLQLLQHLYEQMPDTKVILISGYEDFAYAKTALKYGAKGYVLKPIDTEELLGIVDGIIAQRRQGKPALEQEIPCSYHEEIVAKSIRFIQEHIGKPLSLTDVAAHVHLTPHYLGQLFKNETGKLFNTYLTQLRLEKASGLLRRTNLKVYEICEQAGYIDAKYFSKVFQKQYNMTPNEYRQQNKNTAES